ncbi:MAG: amidohydrolase family protein [Spirochaetales bacterium]|nr:amidohydrolase family protein [Spirochaetales bacterium]
MKSQLLSEIREMRIIDAHEHLQTWENHKKRFFSFFDLLVPYAQFDLWSAGMPAEMLWNSPSNNEEARKYWEIIRPLWPAVNQGAYARIARRVLQEFYGIDDLNDGTWEKAGELLTRDNTKSQYYKTLKEKCRIDCILNQIGRSSFDDPFMRGAIGIPLEYAEPGAVKNVLDRIDPERHFTLDDYTDYVCRQVREAHKEGAVLVKLGAVIMTVSPDRKAAEQDFKEIAAGKPDKRHKHIGVWISDKVLALAGELGMVAAVHTGVWGDIRNQSPLHLFEFAESHPETVFDIYHMGFPWARECAFLGKNYPNVNLNLTWAPTVSPRLAAESLDIWMDLVPSSKIIGFGGDMAFLPQMVWAAQEATEEVLAAVMTRRISRGVTSSKQASNILQSWLYDNPTRIYNL